MYHFGCFCFRVSLGLMVKSEDEKACIYLKYIYLHTKRRNAKKSAFIARRKIS